jgi:hypothetical protein
VYFKRLEPEAFTFLSALREGKSLSVALELAFRETDDQTELLGVVTRWFENWSKLGWFCRPTFENQK